MADGIFSVSELTSEIKQHLELEFSSVTLRGEISNFKRHSSGHLYFTLKDEKSQLSAIIWRTTAIRLAFEPEDGLEILVTGRVEVYAPQGRYQLICDTAKPIGEGYLQQEYQKLLKRLGAEGLFDENHKKMLPRLPERIGIITSPTGAVIADIRTVLARRYPAADLVLYPVRVQGEGAKEEIKKAIEYFNHPLQESHRVEVMIVGRGGGSLEDLWAFNEESVARAIFKSILPIISAVGHQTDITISDFVADVRAATPSQAAELVAPSSQEVLGNVNGSVAYLQTLLFSDIETKAAAVREITESYGFNKPRRDVETLLQTVDRLSEKNSFQVMSRLQLADSRLRALYQQLTLLGHQQSLKRGFALIFKNGLLVRSGAELQAGDELMIQFADGKRSVVVSP
jgi:exodeoxyribonuclease VII large subunit